MERYFEDKANIFKYQKPGDLLFVGLQVSSRIPQGVVPPIIPDWELKIIGDHNRENASLAAAALKALGLSEEQIRDGLESFSAVEGRLQYLRELHLPGRQAGGVKIYNDNNATTPEATVAALRSVDGPVTLILGGSEKGLDLKDLVSEIQNKVSHVIVLSHPNYKGTERLIGDLKQAGVEFEEAASLDAAVASAIQKAKAGTILFSPAFASFGMFKNEYERNDQFLELISQLL